ncbi:MAG: restriction endonuclease [Bacteroidota bacterium]
MPAFYHKDFVSGKEINDNPFIFTCHYCSSPLSYVDIIDQWDISNEQILQGFYNTIRIYKELHSLEDCYLNLRLDHKTEELTLESCKICGWWRIIKTICVPAEEWQIWDIRFGCVGTLKNLDLKNINIPVEEVRNFLAAEYDKRNIINPKIYENVVASVFKSHGYNVIVTGYTHDGGIDVILENGIEQIGVQVKRSINAIEVEQIRSFIGALILGKYRKGIYVTTSSFRKGGVKTVQNLNQINKMSIELINAERFYDALEIAQVRDDRIENLFHSVTKIPSLNYYDFDTPYNSL